MINMYTVCLHKDVKISQYILTVALIVLTIVFQFSTYVSQAIFLASKTEVNGVKGKNE